MLALLSGCTRSSVQYVEPDAGTVDLATTRTYDFAEASLRSDFSEDPVIDIASGTPSDAPQLFAMPGQTSGGPCLVEPESGAWIPLNWIRTRIRFIPAGVQNLFEIRFHAAREQNDLVVYTTSRTWTMPLGVWKTFTTHLVGEPITVTVRGAVWDGQKLDGPPAGGEPSTFMVSPVPATGSIVYSSVTAKNEVSLRGADITDETSHVIIRPSATGSQCIGCHAAVPDAVHVGVVQSQDGMSGSLPNIGIRGADGRAHEPPWLTAAARILLATPGQDSVAFSRSHYTTGGDRLALSVRPFEERTEIVWTDLEAASTDRDQGSDSKGGWGVMARNGDRRSALTPVFFHSGASVLYVSATRSTSSDVVTDGKLMTIPWSARQGGVATPVAGAGAQESIWNEYAPSLSPDDRYIAYARVPYNQGSQGNMRAEIVVVPTLVGGTPSRLEANDPPACLGRTSPGVGNSWPRFSPDAWRVEDDKTTTYWAVFSSKRGQKQNAQLYITAIRVDERMQPPTITSTPPLYLWSQPPDDSNHTPSWEPLHLQVE